jgi:hypothetical protein
MMNPFPYIRTVRGFVAGIIIALSGAALATGGYYGWPAVADFESLSIGGVSVGPVISFVTGRIGS